jgi:hypothetical protein
LQHGVLAGLAALVGKARNALAHLLGAKGLAKVGACHD